ncbi:helix-turn-helix domain-containing protein [Nocardia takedensis]|uniref:helix-turn-helix domain-containing protein n=1 Tax=Nocardia takedensis TaxID=259390 RepID=UPI003F7697D4
MPERVKDDEGDAADHVDPDPGGGEDNLTTAQLAREWQVSSRTIRRYIAAGRLRAMRLPGGDYRIRRADIDAAAKIAS